MSDTMIEFVPGIRFYEYRKNGKTRYALHVSPGVDVIDLDIDQAVKARDSLAWLVVSPEERAKQWAELLKLPDDLGDFIKSTLERHKRLKGDDGRDGDG